MNDTNMDWFERAHASLKAHFADPISEGELQATGMAAIDGFHWLFHELIKEVGIRDDWPEQFCHIVPFGTGTIEKSGKMGVELTLAISGEGWLLSSRLRHAVHIRHMTDAFWAHIVKIATIGRASLSGCGRVPKTEGEKLLLQHEGSLVFSLARDYVMSMERDDDTWRHSAGSLGSIDVLLPLDRDEEAVRQFFRDGIESFYRANYLLYRHAYQMVSRTLKREGYKEPQLSETLKGMLQTI